MDDLKVGRLIEKFDTEGAQSLTKRIVELLEKQTESDFSIAVLTVNKLNDLGRLSAYEVSSLLTEVRMSEVPILWKLTFFLEADFVNDDAWQENIDTILSQLSDLEDYRAVHALSNKVFRKMGGKALKHYQPHSEKILALRSKLQSSPIGIELKGQVGESESLNSINTLNTSLKVMCVISTWPQKTDSTHMGVVYLLKELVTNGNAHNEFHLVVSGESETFSPFGRLTSLTQDIVDEQVDYWVKNGGKKEHLFSNIDITNDPATKNVKIINAANYVSSIAPDLLLYVGGPYESTLFRKLMFPYFATCVVPTSIKGTPALGFDGVVATSDEAADKFNKRFKELTYRVPKPFMLFQNNNEYEGWFPDVGTNGVVVATVLGGNRIEKCLKALSDDELSSVARIFLENENFTWIFVGKTDMRKIASLSEEFNFLVENKRIVYIEYVTEIRSFLRRLDIFFVIPGMTGGGQGAQAAMFENVAVICPFICDVAALVPQEGKYENIEQCRDIISQVADKNALSIYKNTCRHSVLDSSVNRVSKHWQNAFEEMARAALNRVNRKS